MEFIRKNKFIHSSSINLILSRDPNKDRVSFSLTIEVGVRNSFRVLTKFYPNPLTLFYLCHDGVSLNDCRVEVAELLSCQFIEFAYLAAKFKTWLSCI